MRLISARPDGEVSREERLYTDESEPRVLDVIEVGIIEPRPWSYQRENWLIDARARWVQAGRVTWKELFALTDYPLKLWKNSSKSFAGKHDRVSLEESQLLEGSLHFLHLRGLRYLVITPQGNGAMRRVQGAFRYQGVNYRLWVTDPEVERTYLGKADGEYRIGECYATISLSEPFLGHCYKLIATVITAERAEA